MKRIRLGMKFNERTFAARFAESLSDYYDITILEEVIDAGVDLFITDIVDIEADIYIVWDKMLEDNLHIYAFSGINGIRKKIDYAYGLLKGMPSLVISASDTAVISVCSSQGGSGVSSFALSLAEQLTGRTVYVSLEDIPYEENGSTPVDINRFMYELNDDFDRAGIDSVTYEGEGKVSHIRYRKPFNLLNCIETAELQKLFLKLSGSYDNIVADLGTRVNMISMEILRLSSCIFHLWRDERSSKADTYMDILGCIDCSITEVENFCDVAYSEDGDLFSEDLYRFRKVNGSSREIKEYFSEKCHSIAEYGIKH